MLQVSQKNSEKKLATLYIFWQRHAKTLKH